MTVNVVSGLKKKRDELSKQLLNHRTEMHKTIAALDSLDSTIRLYESQHNLSNKVRCGKFSTVFFLQVLEVIGCEKLSLDSTSS